MGLLKEWLANRHIAKSETVDRIMSTANHTVSYNRPLLLLSLLMLLELLMSHLLLLMMLERDSAGLLRDAASRAHGRIEVIRTPLGNSIPTLLILLMVLCLRLGLHLGMGLRLRLRLSVRLSLSVKRVLLLLKGELLGLVLLLGEMLLVLLKCVVLSGRDIGLVMLLWVLALLGMKLLLLSRLLLGHSRRQLMHVWRVPVVHVVLLIHDLLAGMILVQIVRAGRAGLQRVLDVGGWIGATRRREILFRVEVILVPCSHPFPHPSQIG